MTNLRTMVVGLIDDHVAKALLILMMLCFIGMRWILLQLLPTCWIIQRGYQQSGSMLSERLYGEMSIRQANDRTLPKVPTVL